MTEKSYSEIRREFYEKYQKVIVPAVKKFDNERKRKLVIAIICSTILSIPGILCFISLFGGDVQFEMVNLRCSVIFICLACFFWYCIKKSFENKIKEKIMPIVCSCFNDLRWHHDVYNHGQVFKSSGVVPNFTGEDYDDIFYGKHKDVNIEIVESAFDIGSGKSRTTVFKGVVIKLDMNKEFTSHTVITPDKFFHKSPLPDLRHTTLEDIEFEKKFDVFTNDEVDARYLITPSFMQRIKAIKTAFKADKVQCAFYGNLLLVALSTNKDLFSLCSLVKPVDDPKQYFQMYEEIISIIKLIDHFKLDQKIGL